MAKSIRSKAKRKLRAVKREKITAKLRLQMLAKQEQEEGIKMAEDQQETSNTEEIKDASVSVPRTEPVDGDQVMEVTDEQEKSKQKKFKGSKGKNVKRLNKKKKKNKYKW